MKKKPPTTSSGESGQTAVPDGDNSSDREYVFEAEVYDRIDPELGPTELVVAGDRIAKLIRNPQGDARNETMVVRKLSSGEVIVEIPLEKALGIGALDDGSVVAARENQSTRRESIERLAPGATKPESIPVSLAMRAFGWLLAGGDEGGSDAVWFGDNRRDRSLTRLTLAAPTGALARATWRLPATHHVELGPPPALFASGPRGSALYLEAGGKIGQAIPDGSPGESAKSRGTKKHWSLAPIEGGGSALHVVMGPSDDSVWVTDSERHIHLVTLEAKAAAVKKTVSLAGDVIHLARAGSNVAVLVVDPDPARGRDPVGKHGGLRDQWYLEIIGTGGRQRRIKLPEAGQVPQLVGGAPSSELLSRPYNFVAASATHVAVSAGDALTAWRLGDGELLFRDPVEGRSDEPGGDAGP
jgi:hypothetical protein